MSLRSRTTIVEVLFTGISSREAKKSNEIFQEADYCTRVEEDVVFAYGKMVIDWKNNEMEKITELLRRKLSKFSKESNLVLNFIDIETSEEKKAFAYPISSNVKIREGNPDDDDDDSLLRFYRDDNPCGRKIRKRNCHHGLFGGDADDDD